MTGRQDGESTADFARRVQNLMCQAANLIPTNHTAADKVDLLKRLPLDAQLVTSSAPSSASSRKTADIRRVDASDRVSVMVRQVKEVLPDVPVSVISQDLSKYYIHIPSPVHSIHFHTQLLSVLNIDFWKKFSGTRFQRAVLRK